MKCEHEFLCPLPNGLHARPASHLQEVTNRYRSEIILTNQRNGKTANAKSVLALVCADVQTNDACTLQFTGDDAELAGREVVAFIREKLASYDEPLPVVNENAGETIIPRSLREAGLKEFLSGTALCRGLGRGEVVVIGGLRLPENLAGQTVTDPSAEQRRVEQAIATVADAAAHKIDNSRNVQEREIRKAHLAILQDAELFDRIRSLIREKHFTAGRAIVESASEISANLMRAQSALLRERVADIQDVCAELIAAIYGSDAASQLPVLTKPSVCVAETLTPGQLLALERRHIAGLVLGHAGATSHVVILARSFGIPTIDGVPVSLRNGEDVVVDGELGIAVRNLTPAIERYYRRAERIAAARRAKLEKIAAQPAKTADGCRLEVAANVASAEEVEAAFRAGAEGVGLFRTEMLFMDRDTPPSEDEQFAVYAAAAKAANGKPVIIRSIDIGGDKPVPYLNLPAETNPFLGFRGVRMYEKFADLVRTQFRAVARAAAHGDVRLMAPMISCVEEVRFAKKLLLEAGGEKIPFGIMVEVPAVAFAMPELVNEVDFFSIGTNDLTQYFMAADRDNADVAPLYRGLQPSFLRLLRQIVSEAKRAGKWIGVCGELAENAAMLPVWVGLGVSEISMAPPRIASVKAAIGAMHEPACAELASRACACADRAELKTALENFRRSPVPHLTPALVVCESDAATKAEVIREAADLLWLDGRTERPELVEEEIWKREETYSTGFGYGFAIPHCKSRHLGADSIAILKLRDGVEWGSSDGQPVRVAILLAIREGQSGKEHLKILAQLSRMVMHEDFRERLTGGTDPATLSAFVMEKIKL
jgi:multiphosphoryl transfer protein